MKHHPGRAPPNHPPLVVPCALGGSSQVAVVVSGSVPVSMFVVVSVPSFWLWICRGCSPGGIDTQGFVMVCTSSRVTTGPQGKVLSFRSPGLGALRGMKRSCGIDTT
jgi:hypothetical protein